MSYAITLARRPYVGLGYGPTASASGTVSISSGRPGATKPAPAPAAPVGPDPLHSYAAQIGVNLNANVSQFKAQALAAKQAAADFAVSQGVPDIAFVALDMLAHGSSAKDVADKLRKAAAGAAAGAAVSFVTRVSSTQMAEATGLTPGEVDAGKAIIAGTIEGDMPLSKIANIVGAAVGFAAGSALCGPLCGMVGGIIGGAVADVISGLFSSKPPVDYTKADSILAEMLKHLEIDTQNYLAMEREVDTNVRYAAALAYNRVLEYNITEVADANLIQAELTKTGVARTAEDYQRKHGGVTVSQQVVVPAREDFIAKVKARVDAQYPGMWARDAAEAGYTLLQSRMLPGNVMDVLPGHAPEWLSMSDGGGGLRSEQPGSDAEGALIRTFGMVYDANVIDQNDHLYCHSGPGGQGADSFPDDADWGRTPGLAVPGCRDLGIEDEQCNGHGDWWPGAYNRTDQAAYIARWECSFPKHLAWFRDVAQLTANEWSRVASRSAGIVAIKAKQAAHQQIVNAVNAATNQVQRQAAKAAESVALLTGRRQQAWLRSQTDAKMAAAKRAHSFMGGAVSPVVVGVLAIGAGVAGALYYLLRKPTPAPA